MVSEGPEAPKCGRSPGTYVNVGHPEVMKFIRPDQAVPKSDPQFDISPKLQASEFSYHLRSSLLIFLIKKLQLEVITENISTIFPFRINRTLFFKQLSKTNYLETLGKILTKRVPRIYTTWQDLVKILKRKRSHFQTIQK